MDPFVALFDPNKTWRSAPMVCCLTILLVSGCGQVESEKVYQTQQGPAVTLSSLENKWQVINYWATWCARVLQKFLN